MKINDFSHELSEGDDPKLDEFVKRKLHYQYLFTYTEKGERYGYCTSCRKHVAFFKRDLEEKEIENMYKKHNNEGFCPECHAEVIFKDLNRPKGKVFTYGRFVTYETDAGGILFRFYASQADYRFTDVENVTIDYFEEYRLYLNPTSRKCIMWRRHIGYIGYTEGVYQRRMLGRYATGHPYIGSWEIMAKPTYRPINYEYAEIYEREKLFKTLRRLKSFKYVDEKFVNKLDMQTLMAYLIVFTKHQKQTEYLSKTAYREILEEYLQDKVGASSYRPCLSWNGKTLYSLLRMTKAQEKEYRQLLSESKKNKTVCSYTLIFWQQLLKNTEFDMRLKRKIFLGLSPSDFSEIAAMVPTYKKDIKELIGYALSKSVNVSHWRDYLRFAKWINWDINDRNVFYPRDVKESHNRAMEIYRAQQERIRIERELKNKEQAEKEKKKLAEKFKNIKSQYKALEKRFYFESGDLLIRPAKSFEEIVEEGVKQHICVGHTNQSYIKNHAEGTAFILFVRKTEAPGEPFYTVEITNKNVVLQCRGKNNVGKIEIVENFMKEFENYLKNGKSLKSA